MPLSSALVGGVVCIFTQAWARVFIQVGPVDVVNHALAPPPHCPCPTLPLNSQPIKFGAPLKIINNAGDLSVDLKESYIFFFEWLNEVRGGLCIGGQRYLASLQLVNAENKTEVTSVTHQLIDDGVKFLLSPYGTTLTRPVAEVAHNRKVMLMAGAASTTDVFAGKATVFGTLPPATKTMDAVFEILRQDQSIVITTIQRAGSSFGEEACAGVAALAPNSPPPENITDADVPNLTNILREKLHPTNGVLIGCGFTVDMCNEVVQSLANASLKPKAVVLTVCIFTQGFAEEVGKFSMGTTAWLPQFNIQAQEPSVDSIIGTSANWAALYSARFGHENAQLVVSYQAAASWAACAAVSTAMEQSGSIDPMVVSGLLLRERNKLTVPTIFSRITFDKHGQNDGLWGVAQQQGDNTVHFIAPTSIGRTDPAIYPKPSPEDRPCWESLPANSAKGFDDSNTCVTCTRLRSPQVSAFDSTTMRRHCVSCTAGQTPLLAGDTAECTTSCPPGTGLPTTGSGGGCAICPVGQYSDGFFCQTCVKGEFSDAPGATACQACALGTFSEINSATACEICAAGRAATQERSSRCRRCSKGTFSNTNGSSSCRLCDAGMVAPEIESQGCFSCQAGTFSAWGARECDLCNAGTYQNREGQSYCIDGASLGASFDARGLASGINKDWFWTTVEEDDLSWELCIQNPNACLQNERCKLGTTGYQCASCIPGYAHVRSRGAEACFKCPPRLQNLAVTVFVFAVCVWVVFWLARASVQSFSRPRDKRAQLMKLAISYFLMADVAFEMTMETVLDYLYSREWAINNVVESIHWIVWPFRLFPGFMLESESGFWSIHCLFQKDKPELAALLSSLPTRSFYDPAYKAAFQELADYQTNAEQALTIFFLLWPLLIMATSYLVSLFVVLRHLRKHREYYEQAFMFYDDLVVDKDRATSTRTQGAWMAYLATYESMIAGLWTPVPHAEVRMTGKSCLCWKSFHYQGLPVLHSILLVCQGGALLGCMRPLVCSLHILPTEGPENVNTGNDPYLRRHAAMLACEYSDVASMLGCVLWGLLSPLAIWVGLKRATGKWAHGHNENCVVLTGYAYHAYYWEALTMLVKFVMLVCVRAGNDGQLKNLLLVLLGMLYGVVSMSANPYKFRLVGRINAQFILLWIVHVFISDFLSTLVMQDPPAWLVLLLISGAVLLHAAFLIHLGYQLHFQNLVNFMMGIDVEAWQRSLEEPRARNIITIFRRKALGQYMRHLRSKPYVSLMPSHSWVAMTGNRADVAAIPPRIEKPTDLSDCPFTPVNVNNAAEATCGQKLELLSAVRLAMGLVVEATGNPTISISLLEFVIRAGMVLGMHHEHQRRKITRYLADPGKIQKQSVEAEVTQQAGTDKDPLELLGSVDELENGASPPGRRGRAVSGGADEDDELGALAESRWLCQEVQSREFERRSGVLPRTTHSTHVRKRASAATHGSSAFVIIDASIHMLTQQSGSGSKTRSILEDDATPEQTDRCMERIRRMFSPATFNRGVELGSLELGLMDLAEVAPVEMKLWIDTFEGVWTELKAKQLHKESRLTGRIADFSTQTEAVRHEERQLALAPTARDPWTVSALPLLGILPPSQSARSRVGITTTNDKETQTDSGQTEGYHPSIMNLNFHPMEDRSKAAALSWARLVSLYAIPPVKVVGTLLHNRTVRYLRDLSLEITAAEQALQAARNQRQALERRQVRHVLGHAKSPKPTTEKAGGTQSLLPAAASPLLGSKQKVLPPVSRGMYED